MNTGDSILQAVLVLIVIKQVRESRLEPLILLAPLGLMGWAATKYLPHLPTGGNDLVLIGAGVAAGTVLGVLAGLATHMRHAGGDVLIRAGAVAAGVWVFGMGFRLVFEVGADHGLGPALTSFSIDHAITGAGAWAGAFVLMASAQVLARFAVIFWRAHRMTAVAGPRPARPVAA